MQTTSFGHRRQGRSFPADVSEHLEHHEAQEKEVEAGTYSSHDDERHLEQSWSRKSLSFDGLCSNKTFYILAQSDVIDICAEFLWFFQLAPEVLARLLKMGEND